MQRALENGAKTIGYLQWSYTDNLEWVFGYTIKFGLVGVDLSSLTLTRIPKHSYYLYQSILKHQPK